MGINRRRLFRASVSGLASVLILSSCVLGEGPFLMVQFCVGDDNGVHLLKEEFQSIAHDEQMRYIDASAATERDLKELGVLEHKDGKFVYVGLDGDAGLALEGGNLGLNTYDIVVGFSRGQDYDKARAFSDRVISRLKRHWTLKVVPEGSGAFPNPECVEHAQAPPNNSSKPTPLRGAA